MKKFERLLRAIRRSRESHQLQPVVSLFEPTHQAPELERFITVETAKTISSLDRASGTQISRPMPAVFAYVARNLDVWPDAGVALTRNAELISESLPSILRWTRMLEAGFAKKYKKTERQALASPLVAYLGGGIWYENHYHRLVDEVTKLFWLSSINEQILLLLPSSYGGEIEMILREFAPKNVTIRVSDGPELVYQVSRLLICPQVTVDFCGHIPAKCVLWIRAAASSIEAKGSAKIFISRECAPKRRVVNEQELSARLREMGFDILRLEDMRLEDQIAAFRAAKLVVAPHGAGLANLLFCDEKTRVIELCGMEGVHHYRWLCSALDLNYYSARALAVIGQGKNSDFKVNVSEVLSLVERSD